MLIRILLAASIGLFAYAGVHYFYDTGSAETNKSPDEKTVPVFSFTDLNDQHHAVTDFKGKTIILNFWASWCAPCIEEFPKLITAAQKNKDDAVLIALSSDWNEDAIMRFIEKHEILTHDAPNVFIAHDKKGDITSQLFGVSALPVTLIIDPEQQHITKTLKGNTWTAHELQEAIDLASRS